MFLLRCLFWLGLAFSQIALREGGHPAAFIGLAATVATAQSASLGQVAPSVVETQCRADPGKCMALAASTTKLLRTDAPARGRDTLSGADRAPVWRTTAQRGEGG
jgi:hypothetical protein